MQYPSSELVLNDQGQVYHLGLHPENLADDIILVGDQDRVNLVSSFFDSIEHKSQHREFVCHTGTYQNKRISVISTGIGTDNIDITLNEIDALANIDLKNRIDKESKKSLNLIRIGTCGILRPEIDLHSYILSTHAYGLDNIAHFYDMHYSQEEVALNEALNKHLQLPSKIQPYLVSSDSALTAKLESEKTVQGITVTSSGFYAPQGRQLRIPMSTSNLNENLGTFEFDQHVVTNFEMESSALFALGKAMGHRCTTICLGIANRPNMKFSKGYAKEMNALIQYVLDRI